jgi:hypothetical protein
MFKVASLALALAAKPARRFPAFRRQFRRSCRRSIPSIKATSANMVRKRLNYSLLCLRRGRKTAFLSPPTRLMAPTPNRLSTCTVQSCLRKCVRRAKKCPRFLSLAGHNHQSTPCRSTPRTISLAKRSSTSSGKENECDTFARLAFRAYPIRIPASGSNGRPSLRPHSIIRTSARSMRSTMPMVSTSLRWSCCKDKHSST